MKYFSPFLNAGLQITGSVLMNIVPMDTMSGGREDLIGRDITIRITIEILESGLYNTGSIILLGVEVRTVLTLTTPVTNLGPGSSLHCPVWYTGISTGMILRGRYEADGRRGITSTAGVGRRIRRSPGRSPRSAWPARPPDPHARPAAADPAADLPAATPSAAAAVPAATGKAAPRILTQSRRPRGFCVLFSEELRAQAVKIEGVLVVDGEVNQREMSKD